MAVKLPNQGHHSDRVPHPFCLSWFKTLEHYRYINTIMIMMLWPELTTRGVCHFCFILFMSLMVFGVFVYFQNKTKCQHAVYFNTRCTGLLRTPGSTAVYQGPISIKRGEWMCMSHFVCVYLSLIFYLLSIVLCYFIYNPSSISCMLTPRSNVILY